jgi:D-alanyl-D-alanine carboxypeptidase (penicillin-binding protein 5/6)
MNRYFKLFTVLIFLFSTSVLASSLKVPAKTAILIDYHTEKILYELEPDLSIYPASMTKIMTSIIAFDLLEEGKISLEDKVTVSNKAWRMSQAGYSSMFIMINDEISIENLLRGIIVASGNDSCVALAEGIAGTEEDFVTLMNEKAIEIGMTNTNFNNSSGINDPDNYSTVRDIALMSKYLINKHPKYYEYFKELEFTWDRTGGDPIKQNNRNRLLFKNIGVDGIKTGHLVVEGYSLASSIKKDTRRLIAVGSGFKTKTERTRQSNKMLSWGLMNTLTYEISKNKETNFEIKTWLGKKATVNGITKEDVYVTINKRELKDFKTIIEYTGPIKAPIKIDQEVAKINVFIKDKLIKSVPVYSSEKIKKVNFLISLFTSLNYMIWGDV